MAELRCARTHMPVPMIELADGSYQCPTCLHILDAKLKDGRISKLSESIPETPSAAGTAAPLGERYRHLFMKLTRWGPISSYIGALVLAQLIYAIHFLLVRSTGEQRKLLTDFNWATALFIGLGLGSVVYLTRQWRDFYTIFHERCRGDAKKTRRIYTRILDIMFDARHYVAFGLTCSAAMLGVLLIFGTEYYDSFIINAYGFYFFGMLGAFVSGIFGYTLLAGIAQLYYLSRQDLLIDIYARDRAGGMREFGRMSMKQTIVTLLMLSSAGIIVFFNPMVKGSVFITAAYLCAAIFGASIVFFAPLISIRRKVIGFKEKELQEVHGKIKSLIVGSRARTEFMKKIYLDPDKQSVLDRLESSLLRIDEIREWPFDFSIVWQLATAFAIPLLLTLIELFLT